VTKLLALALCLWTGTAMAATYTASGTIRALSDDPYQLGGASYYDLSSTPSYLGATTISNRPGGAADLYLTSSLGISDINDYNRTVLTLIAYSEGFNYGLGLVLLDDSHTAVEGFTVFTDGFRNVAAYALDDAAVVSAVPLPATLPLLATGLGGLWLIGRRR